MYAGAGAIALAACSQPAYGGCVAPAAVTMKAPCGFTSVTSTCNGARIDTSVDGKTSIVSDMTASCTIDAVLGDGTTHTVDVVIGTRDNGPCAGSFTVVSPTNAPDFTSTTCH